MNCRIFFQFSFWMSFLFISFSCQKPLFPDKDKGPKTKWESIDFRSERLIQALHVTPFELYAISENQFARFDSEHGLLDKRPLDMASGVRGVPALSDNAFVRLTVDNQARQYVEFHLARNPAQIWKMLADTLVKTPGSFAEVDFFARTLGAFTHDGTQFLLPVKLLPARHYAFFLFQINYNITHSNFANIKISKRIDVADMSSDHNNLVNVRFLDGNFFITAREGAWRITPSGQVKKIFAQWMRDIFSHNGKLYITGINPFDLHESTDKGLNWIRLNKNSELKMTETAAGKVFSQEVLGHPFMLADEDFVKVRPIIWPEDAITEIGSWYSVQARGNRLYFSIDRKIYFTEEIVLGR